MIRRMHMIVRRCLERTGGRGGQRLATASLPPETTVPNDTWSVVMRHHTPHHHLAKGHPPAVMDLAPSRADAHDEAVAVRVIAAFVRARQFESTSIPAEQQPNEGIWEMNKLAFHKPMYDLLERQDAPGLASCLCNGLRTTAGHGIGGGAHVFEAAVNPESSSTIATLIVDHLVTLAEALGVLPVENPEQGRWGVNLYEDLDELCRSIERVTGHLLGFPRVFGNFGVRVGERLIDVRTPDTAYTCHRMNGLLNGLEGRSILEIGAGFGGTAYYGVLRGVDRFTIIDLPFMNALQGFFLIKALGDDRVRLFGEQNVSASVQVQPYWEIQHFHDRQFDLTMNHDSLPELPLARAREYIDTIPRYTASFFYSINQESMGSTDRPDGQQLVVPRLLEGNAAYRRIGRFPYWLRPGYVEEVYQLNPD